MYISNRVQGDYGFAVEVQVHKNHQDDDFPVYGISPQGGNAKEGTADGFAAIRNTEMMDVPLVYDKFTNTWVSKLAAQESIDRNAHRVKDRNERERDSLLNKAGFN